MDRELPDARVIEHRALRRAAGVQMSVIGALMLRELHTRFGRRNLGFVWMFVEPALLGLFVASVRILKDRALPGGINIIAFAVMGYVIFYVFRSVVSRATHAGEQNEPLLWHARVTLEDVMLARTLLDTGAVLVTGVVFLVVLGVAVGEWPTSWVQMGLGLLMMAALAHGVALIVLAMTRFGTGTVERITHPMLYISIMFTGTFYMVWWLPKPMQDIVLLLPLVHVFEFVREGQFGPGIPYHYDLGFIVICIVALNVYGGLALRAARPQLEL